jgi:hypothetical protein
MRASTFGISVSLLFASLGSSGCLGSRSCTGSACADDESAAAEAAGAAGASESAASPSAAAAAVQAPAGEGGRDPGAFELPELDSVPPTVVSVSPADGAIGVHAGSRIHIQFSEPMDEQATQAALESSTRGPELVSASWSDAGTVLTLSPRWPLRYPEVAFANTNPEGQLIDVQPQRDDPYTIRPRGRDRAGNALPETSSSFYTLRQVTHRLSAAQALTGVVLADDAPTYFGFLSFDLASLPTDIEKLRQGVLNANGVELVTTSNLTFYDVTFAELDQTAIHAPGSLIGTLPSGSSGDQSLLPAALDHVFAAYRARSPESHYLQARFELPSTTSAAAASSIAAVLPQVSLTLDYFAP